MPFPRPPSAGRRRGASICEPKRSGEPFATASRTWAIRRSSKHRGTNWRRKRTRSRSPPTSADPRARARLAPGRDRGAAPAHRGGRAARGRAGGRGRPRRARTARAHGRPAGRDLRHAELRQAHRDQSREEGARGGPRPPAAGGGRGTLVITDQGGMTMAALEEKVIASWKYKQGALDPKTAYLCYLAADLACG